MRDHAQEAIDLIDRVLEEPLVPLDVALQQAVAANRMTLDEARECYDAYLQSEDPSNG
jgi:hypothetical protein